MRVYGCTCKQRNTSSRQESNRQISSVEEHPPFSGKIHTCFDGYPGRSGSQHILSMPHRGQSCPSTHSPTHRASTRTASRWPLFSHRSSIFFFGQHGLSFIFAIGTQQSHLHQRQYPTRDSSGSASALAEMSSQASPRSLGDHLRLHRRPGLTASLSSNSCSKRQGCVRLSPQESLEAIHPIQTFSGRLPRRASLSSSLWRKTGPQLAFLVLGTNRATGHCTIGDWLRRRALSRRAGREDERRVFCNLHCGERQVDGEIFIFGCTCPVSRPFLPPHGSIGM